MDLGPRNLSAGAQAIFKENKQENWTLSNFHFYRVL